jgi:hypothetical protein
MTATPVLAELVALASKHTNTKVVCREGGQTIAEMDWVDAAEACDTGYAPSSSDMSLYMDMKLDTDLTAFWEELDRLQKLVTKPLDEPILPDDYPVHQGYLYVANGKVTQFIDGMNMTVGRWKALTIPGIEKVTEVKRCDIAGRQARRPIEKPKKDVSPVAHRWNTAGTHINQAKRRPRSSDKIKKVK